MVRPARFLLNHMLQVIRDNYDNRHIWLTEDFAKDLNWFYTSLCLYNGVNFDDSKPIQSTISLDASLTGLGAVFQNLVYALPYNITQLEIQNIMVAFKECGHSWQDMFIK